MKARGTHSAGKSAKVQNALLGSRKRRGENRISPTRK